MSIYLYHDEPIAGAPSSADRVVYGNGTVESALDELSETIGVFGKKLYGVGNTSEIFDIPNIEKYTVIAVHISYAADSVIFLVKNENGHFYGTGSYYTAGTTVPTALKLIRNNTAKGWSVNGAATGATSMTIKGVYGLF